MKQKKYYILLFRYHYIYLFTEIDGKICKINFAGGKEKLSNCVAFSYDKEDLVFLPDGDPFEVNSNSSFSDFLDFAGYHFEAGQAIEEIVSSIIKNDMISGFKKGDDIFLCTQLSYYESNYIESDGGDTGRATKKRSILGSNVYIYDFNGLIQASINLIRRLINNNVLLGYPLMSIFLADYKDYHTAIFAPTIEKTVVDDFNDKYPLSTHIPKKLLRNVKNRIIISKLYNQPLPEKAIYQNRIIDITKSQLAERFDEFITKAAEYIKENIDKNIKSGKTFIFDFGMNQIIKNAFLSFIKEPYFIDESHNIDMTCLILRVMLIEHIASQDFIFLMEANKKEQSEPDFKKATFRGKGVRYFDVEYILAYLIDKKRLNLNNVKEMRALMSIFNKE